MQEIQCTAHEKMPAIISYQGNASTSYSEIPFTLARIARVISADENVERKWDPRTLLFRR